jgi:integral membrane protein (TIGR00529 family)
MDIAIDILLTAAALAVTVYLLRKQVNLGIVMALDSVFIALAARMPADTALLSAFNGAVSESTVKLILILFLIMMIENIMRSTGMIRTMTDSLKELVGSNRLAAGMLPAVIGLLPSPGGAHFSCPMVEEVTGGASDSGNKAFINYWFRHIWLDGFILYPGVILAAELLKVSVISMFLHLIPFMLASILLGCVYGLRKVGKEKIARTRPAVESLRTFIVSMLPVITVITVYIILLKLTPYSLEIAAGSMVVLLFAVKRYSFGDIVKTARDAFPVKLVLIILGVMVFKEVLLESGAITGLSELMNAYGIPAAILFILLPFAGGFTSGITVSYVSLTFPILIPLGIGGNLWYAAVAFTAGSIGGMTTPLHLCAVMTADYFKTPLTGLLKKIAAAEAPLMALAVVLLLLMLA